MIITHTKTHKNHPRPTHALPQSGSELRASASGASARWPSMAAKSKPWEAKVIRHVARSDERQKGGLFKRCLFLWVFLRVFFGGFCVWFIFVCVCFFCVGCFFLFFLRCSIIGWFLGDFLYFVVVFRVFVAVFLRCSIFARFLGSPLTVFLLFYLETAKVFVLCFEHVFWRG